MNTKTKYSPLIRTISGVLGVLGVAAMGFNATQEGSIQIDFWLFAKLFVGFIFLYVAIFGKNPLDFAATSDRDQ